MDKAVRPKVFPRTIELLSQYRRAFFEYAALLALNVWIAWRLFFLEYTRHLYSVEGYWIGLARYLASQGLSASWTDIWYCGLPTSDVYVPGFHFTTAALTMLSGWSAARSYHFVAGALYALGPVALHFLLKRLGASWRESFTAALAFSILSPFAFIDAPTAADIGGPWFSRRLQVMAVYGEGPHVGGIALALAALGMLQRYLSQPGLARFALAALSIAAVLVTNVPASLGLALGILSLLLAQTQPWKPHNCIATFSAGVLAMIVAAGAFPPSAVATVIRNNAPMHTGFSLAPSRLAVVAALLVALAIVAELLRRRGSAPHVRFGVIHSLLMLAVVVTVRPDFEFLPQSGRLHLEADYPLCIVMAALFWALLARAFPAVKVALAVMLLAGIAIQIGHYRARARQDLMPIDPKKRSEFQSATWLHRNRPGQRVYAPGSTSFWLNAFAANPQLTGCCDQSLQTRVIPDVAMAVNLASNENEAAQAVDYLQAFRVRALIAPGPESTEEYKDLKHPEAYSAVLPLLHRGAGDDILAIPLKDSSLAHVIHEDEIVLARNSDSVSRLAQALNDTGRSSASFKWIANGRGRISTTLDSTDVLSVAVTYATGWTASGNGREIPVEADALGLIVLRPRCDGPCVIDLVWNGSPNTGPARAMAFTALLFLLAMALWPSLRLFAQRAVKYWQ